MLLCLMASVGVWAQTSTQRMQVKSFRKLENDMTARHNNTSRLDNNGRPAALIKVVTYGKGYTFDNGSLGTIGDSEYHGGEIWVYIPERSQKLAIGHAQYGQLRDRYFYFPEAIKAGTVYEMVLDPGVGSFVNVNTNYRGATVWVDGDSIGVAPIANCYLLRGRHVLKAQLGRIVGQCDVYVDDKTVDLHVPMEDLSKNYVNLTLKVADNAEIYYNKERKAVGTWNTELYKGEYYIETRKENCESRHTKVVVEPGMNPVVNLTPPVPYKGTIQLSVAPRGATILLNGDTLSSGAIKQVNVGTYVADFQRKGYHAEERTYKVSKDAAIIDSVRLKRISYVKSNQYYLGAGFTYSPLSGATLLAGATYKNFDLQLSYTLGMLSTDDLVWYYNGEYTGIMNYKQNVFAAKLGYQFEAISRCAVVPQLGYALHTLAGSQAEGMGMTGDGGTCSCLTLGAKVMFVPSQHIGVFLNPEYALAISKGDAYSRVMDGLDQSAGGFFVTAGLIVKF